MNELTKTGKNRTILVSISMLLVSIHTIYFYHSVRPDIETAKLVQQVVRFLLTAGLLYMVYRGRKWAKVVALILFSLAIIGALIGLSVTGIPVVNKIPLIVMVIIYSLAVYHFGLSKSFKAFNDYQNSGKLDGLQK